jgi:GntR family transcriptional regulator/MocR family aminotransferase
MHVCGHFAQHQDDVAVAAAARAAGLIVEPLSRFYTTPATNSGLVLGFAGFRPDVLRDATKHLGDVLRQSITAPGRAATG